MTIATDAAALPAGGSPSNGFRASGAGARALLAAVVLTSFAYTFLLRFNFDAAWLYYVAERVLEGQRLYVDLIEVNPPLIVWLTMPAVFLARLIVVSPRVAFTIYVLLILAVSLTLCAILLRVLLPHRQATRLAVLLVLPMILVQLVLWAFGEREHLMVALVLPYLFLAAGRAVNRRYSGGFATTVGVVAGLGIVLKPYFFALPLLIEAYLLFRIGGRAVLARPELRAIVILFAGYGVAVALLTPEYVAVVDLARKTYLTHGTPLGDLLVNPLFIGCMLTLIAAAALPISPELRSLRAVVLLAGLAFATSMLTQQRGWFYHLYPMLAAAVLAGALVLADKVDSGSSSVSQRRIRLLLTGIFVFLFTLATIGPKIILQPLVLKEDLLRPTIDRRFPSGNILVLSTEIGDAFPLVTNARLGLTSPFAHLWFLPGLYPERPLGQTSIDYRSPSSQTPAERRVVDMIISAAVENPPHMILVNVAPSQPGFGTHFFDYLGYFEQDPRFARLMRHYAPIAEIPPFRIYGRSGSERARIPARSER